MSFLLSHPVAKFAPNSRYDAAVAALPPASIRCSSRFLRPAGDLSRPLTYDLFKLCFYRCHPPLPPRARDYLYRAPPNWRFLERGPSLPLTFYPCHSFFVP